MHGLHRLAAVGRRLIQLDIGLKIHHNPALPCALIFLCFPLTLQACIFQVLE